MPLPLLPLRSPYDRDIVRLAVPALGALAAEPLYLLADTAMVGHLGTDELAALAIAATLLAGTFTLFNFLTYGTTAQVRALLRSRRGAGGRADRGTGAVAIGWDRRGPDRLLCGIRGAAGEPHGRRRRVGDLRVVYLRIGSLGLPFALIALAGQGYLRGVTDLRPPLVIVVAANAVNVVLKVLFIYGFDWGLAGSAWATVMAQACMGVAFVRALLSRAGTTHGARARPELRPLRGSAATSSSARPPLAPSRGEPQCSPGWARTRWPRTRSHSSCSCSWRWCSTRSRSRGR